MNWAIALVLFTAWLGVVAFSLRNRIWLLFYLVGTTGFAYFLIYAFSELADFKTPLAQSVALAVHYTAGALGIETHLVNNAPGMLLVLVLYQRVGWTVLQIGVESSGLLESVVLVSLVLFYPGWTPFQRLRRAGLGLVLTWLANIARMLLIALILHHQGKEALVIAHTFLGKVFFFGLTLAIYWVIVTLPSLGDIDRRIKARLRIARV